MKILVTTSLHKSLWSIWISYSKYQVLGPKINISHYTCFGMWITKTRNYTYFLKALELHKQLKLFEVKGFTFFWCDIGRESFLSNCIHFKLYLFNWDKSIAPCQHYVMFWHPYTLCNILLRVSISISLNIYHFFVLKVFIISVLWKQ